MKRSSVQTYRTLAAQVFLTLSAVLTFDLLYRWESITKEVVGIERFTMIAVVVIPVAIIAAFIALVLFSCVSLLERVVPRLSRALLSGAPWAMGMFIFWGYSRMVVRFAESIMYRFELARGGIAIATRERLLAFIAVVVLGAVFALMTRWARKRVAIDEGTRVLGALLFLFAFLSVLVVLGLVALRGQSGGTHVLQRYSIVLFVGLALLYWRQMNAIFRMRRLFEYPAVAVCGVSVLTVAIAGVLFSRNPEAAVVLQRSERYANPRVKNVILVTFDALAANRMSLYGNPRVTTPNLDALAATSFVFENMHAESDATSQSMLAIHTGLHYYTDRIVAHGRAQAGGHTIGYMPRFFAKLGWDAIYALMPGAPGNVFYYLAKYNDDFEPIAYALHGGRQAQLFARWGLDFPKLSTAWLSALSTEYVQPRLARWRRNARPFAEDEFSLGSSCNRPAARRFDAVRKYLDQRTADSSFIWVHSIAPHEPYCASARFRGSFRDLDPSSVQEVFLQHLDRALAERRSRPGPLSPEVQEEISGIAIRYQHELLADYVALVEQLDVRDLPIPPDKKPLMKELQLMYEEWLLATDAEFGVFLEYLKQSGRFDDTMFIVAADHGQAFRHGSIWNSTRVMYRQTARIPLIIHFPGQTTGKRIGALAHQVDIMPTILETLGYAPPAWMEGEPLGKYMDEASGATSAPREPERTVVSRVLPSKFAFFANPMYKHLHTFVAYRGDYKLIYRYYGDGNLNVLEPPPEAERYFQAFPHVELFNIAKDPRESKNLADAEPEIRDALLEAIRQDIEKVRALRSASK
ncbi:sulfatase-like hydrolase/transferase [Candidatus Uhrbacteria bacterium]|nr:sulfatase-like hydrolase/transferase [Candidatus Uhrbacteria bacterium]